MYVSKHFVLIVCLWYKQNCIANKGGLISESFFGSNLPNNVQNQYPELNPPNKKMIRLVFSTILWKLEPMLKSF